MRPPLDLSVPLKQEDALIRLRARLRKRDCPVMGTVLGRHVELKIHESKRHYWSPCLSLDVDPDGDGCRIHGKFGPHPHVWTLFLAGYAVLACLVIAGAMYGLAQVTLDHQAWALWGVPIGLALAGLLYAAALAGQRLGAAQMGELESFVRRTVPKPESSPTAVAAPLGRRVTT